MKEALEHQLAQLSETQIQELNKEIYEDLDAGRSVRETMESKGWVEFIKPTIDALLTKANTLAGIETVEELKARQVSVSILTAFFTKMEQLKNLEEEAKYKLKELKLDEPEQPAT